MSHKLSSVDFTCFNIALEEAMAHEIDDENQDLSAKHGDVPVRYVK